MKVNKYIYFFLLSYFTLSLLVILLYRLVAVEQIEPNYEIRYIDMCNNCIRNNEIYRNNLLQYDDEYSSQR